MNFRKFRHPSNFRFAQGGEDFVPVLRELGDDVFHLGLGAGPRWPLAVRGQPLNEEVFAPQPSRHRLVLDAQAGLQLQGPGGQVLLHGRAGATFGVCGSAWLWQLVHDPAMRFYGQGEKAGPLERSGRRSLFWNADVWADHAMHEVEHGEPDPLYISIPYLLVQCPGGWVGLLVDHPGAAFMDTASNWFFGGRDDQGAPPAFWLGADQGPPGLYLIAGASAAEVTARLQRLQGTTPLPPLWALGHHQCRWGYAGTADLQRLDAAFSEHQFPNDGLWLDIDHMQGYRVFTTAPQHFGDVKGDLAELAAHGRRVVPILDPGLKVEPHNPVAQSARQADVLCQTPEGEPYVGFVWPGRSWFPDFTLPEGRAWWAEQVRGFAALGFGGFWVDMNDPAAGAAALDEMRFDHGRLPHWAGHNLYANGMAQATRAGLLAARPGERPFVLSRSAATGMAPHAAVWTGDNWSNWHHLRQAIPTSLNLALSGLPFNGPDVPGFGGHADAALAVAWYKAGHLFPFLRNHATAGSAAQEPWCFGPEALAVIRHYVRLRYKLLPYLAQLWLAQAQAGTAVLRPLFHDFESTEVLDLSRIDDQFLVGPAVLQSPLLQPGATRRTLALPGPGRWLDMGSGRFQAGGQRIEAEAGLADTPMHWREGQLLPLQPGERTSPHNDLAVLELHGVLGRGCADEAVLAYQADDGLSQAWQQGQATRCTLRMRRAGDTLHLAVYGLQAAWRPLQVQVVGYDGARELVWALHGQPEQRVPLAPHAWRCSGAPLQAARSPVLVLG